MRIYGLLLAALPGLALAADEPKWTLEFETGPAWQSRNNVARPNAISNRFSLIELQGKGAFRSYRTSLTWEGETGPGWRLLYAPLEISRTGRFLGPVNFDGGSFAAGVNTQGTYRFDSYRLTYRNRWIKSDRKDVRVGVTLKLRDAEVGLRQGGTARTFKNTGFVPLVHLYGEERFNDRWTFIYDVDALGGGPGYAVDAGLRLGYQINERTRAFVGLRILDGGADSDSVYSFATFTYVTAGISVRF